MGVLQHERAKNIWSRTQKPIPLLRELVDNTPFTRVIYDPFGGSGSTLLAAQAEGRIAFIMEADQDQAERLCLRMREELA